MTFKGIFILGLNGAGKTTLGRALAERLKWFRMDVEDYYFPDMTVPFAHARSREDVEQLMLSDIHANGNFVLSSVSADLCDIVKGCIFEWCLCRGDMPVDAAMKRIMTNYMIPLCLNQKPTEK